MAGSGRHLARRCAVQALYQWQMTGQRASEIEDNFIPNDKLTGKHLEFFRYLVQNVPEQAEQLDARIQPHLDRDASLVDPIENAILRVGAFEILFHAEIPVGVVIDEAVDIAKTYSAEHSFRFVNGVLDRLAREVRSN